MIDESIVLIGGEGAVEQTLTAMFSGWPVEFHHADFSDSDGTMAAVHSASLILVAVDEENSGPALACCGILKEHDSGVSAPVALVTPEAADAVLRLAALRAGADDVIGLEHNISAASARISALLRFRALQGEAGGDGRGGPPVSFANAVPDETVKVLVVAEDAATRQDLLKNMLSLTTTIATSDLAEALYLASQQKFDLVVVHGGVALSDAFRICGQLRCIQGMRFVPLFALSEPGSLFDVTSDSARSADDCMAWPGETSEFILRALLHLRRKRYLEAMTVDLTSVAVLPEEVGQVSGLLAPERFATTLNALKRDAEKGDDPLYMGIVRVPESAGVDQIEAVASVIRAQLQGREAASRVEEGLFAILYPDRRKTDVEAAIEMLRDRLGVQWTHLEHRYPHSAEHAQAAAISDIRTALMDVRA